MGDPVFEGGFFTVEAGGEVVGACVRGEVPMGGMAEYFFCGAKRCDFMRNGTKFCGGVGIVELSLKRV
jgi:hypothetical protein